MKHIKNFFSKHRKTIAILFSVMTVISMLSITCSAEDPITTTAQSLTGASIVGNITSAFSTFISGIGSSIVSTFDTIFTNGAGGLSNLAIWGLVFGGVAFATAIIKYFVNKAR